ncbi:MULTISPECIES: TetR/AcrR family transcriptional regulator [Levilactobacillus]|uniref:TetR/AcrR family transcriptional regulator n=1 Tax=Levilactobacillus TaxID=2767886 RepID=UPI003757D2A5
METDAKRLATEVKIQRAFIQLVTTVGFDRLTVQRLSQAAQINRGTFYLHYLDKYDLLTHLENDLVTQVQEIFQRYPKPGTGPTTTDAFGQLFTYLYRQRQLAVVLLNSPASQLRGRVKTLILTVIGPATASPISPAIARELVAQGILDFVGNWLGQEPVPSPEQAYTIFKQTKSLSPQQLLGGTE